MSRKILIEVEVKDFGYEDVEVGDFIEYDDEVYIFEGYEYGTYPIARNLKTNEQVTLPHY